MDKFGFCAWNIDSEWVCESHSLVPCTNWKNAPIEKQ